MSMNLRTMGLNPLGPRGSIAQYADAAISRAMNANQYGEIPGHGPAWACDNFGSYGHNSIACIKCTTNFMSSNTNNKGDNA